MPEAVFPRITWRPAWRRRLMAGAAAISINAAMLVLILLGGAPEAPAPIEALHVTLVTLPPQIEPEAVPEPEPEIIPEPEAVVLPPEPPPVEQVTEATSDSADAPVSARSVAEVPDAPSSGARDVYAVSPATRSILSGIQCPGAPEAFARTGQCPDSARRSVMLAAGSESAEDHYAIDVNALRAEWGIGPGILAGEATLDNPQARRTLSSSDQMRDMLPASRPDPAFGD